MNKAIKNILIGLTIIAVLISIAGNIYYFGWLKLKNSFIRQGVNLAVGQIIQTAQQTGQVQLSKDIILIIKQNADATKK